MSSEDNGGDSEQRRHQCRRTEQQGGNESGLELSDHARAGKNAEWSQRRGSPGVDAKAVHDVGSDGIVCTANATQTV
jgi:hypothetical protein